VTRAELLSVCEEVGRKAGARAEEIETTRHLPSDIASALGTTGLYRAFVPERLGGPALTVQEVVDAVETLARHDGSTAWCGMIAASSSLMSGYLPEPFASEIYGDAGTCTGGFAAPMGKATPADGGFTVSGRWAWGSGTDHCTWIGGGARFPEGPPRFVYFERDQVELLDTWYAAGLKGSGSTDYSVTDAFVPEGRWADILAEPFGEEPTFRFPFYGALAIGISAVSLGLGLRALEEIVGLASGKHYAQSSRTIAERPAVQGQVAEGEAGLRAARAFLREAIGGVEATIATGGWPTDRDKRLLRMAASQATKAATAMVDVAYTVAGGTSVYRDSPLQRLFRDAHVATQHAMVAPRTFELAGRLAFGLPTDTAQL
jgi:indole-3-acetate monooxygenase